MAAAVGRHLRASPLESSSVIDVEAALPTAIMRTAELARQSRSAGDQEDVGVKTPTVKAELQPATETMHTAWQRLKTDTWDAQLRRAIKRMCEWPKRERGAEVVRFFERMISA